MSIINAVNDHRFCLDVLVSNWNTNKVTWKSMAFWQKLHPDNSLAPSPSTKPIHLVLSSAQTGQGKLKAFDQIKVNLQEFELDKLCCRGILLSSKMLPALEFLSNLSIFNWLHMLGALQPTTVKKLEKHAVTSPPCESPHHANIYAKKKKKV